MLYPELSMNERKLELRSLDALPCLIERQTVNELKIVGKLLRAR